MSRAARTALALLCLASPALGQAGTEPSACERSAALGERLEECSELTDRCADRLVQARSLYRVGRHGCVLQALCSCLGELSAQDRIEADQLLAKSLLAVDEEELAETMVGDLLNLFPSFSPGSGEPLAFRRLVRRVQRQGGERVIYSVSRGGETLREAPATVMIVDSAEIERRGYVDLTELLNDLPGFDVARGNGIVYSNFYQRGYRTDGNDRTLVLVDGVEENDLWSNISYLSRQYPLSNVDRVEVVYGPASTMYGPNAFAGVVNILTKESELLLGDDNLGYRVTAGAGSWNSRYVDATVAGRGPQGISFTLTGRLYRSDEFDLSPFEEWDYDPRAFLDKAIRGGYAVQGNLRLDDRAEVEAFLDRTGLDDGQLLALLGDDFDVDTVGSGAGAQVVGAALNDGGARRAAALDQASFDAPVGGLRPAFSDLTDDWLLHGKLNLSRNFSIGFQSWQRREGFSSWFLDDAFAGADNGTLWQPEQLFFYVRYRDSSLLRGRLGLTVQSRFSRHRLGEDSREEFLRSYSNSELGLADFLARREAHFQRTIYQQSSRQFRTEATVNWRASRKLSLVGGLELRSAQIQGDYNQRSTRPEGSGAAFDFSPGSTYCEAESGDPFVAVNCTGGQSFEQTDLGLFAQASLRPAERWKLVVGGRVDHNEVSQAGRDVLDGSGRPIPIEGYGTVFNPRLAVIHSRDRWVWKAIYSEAFKDASNFNRYATAPGVRAVQAPNLEPEEVSNFELAAGWRSAVGAGGAGRPSGEPRWTLDLSAYRAEYSGAVETDPATNQNTNRGALEIEGLQATGRWLPGRPAGRLGGPELWASYTYTDPRDVEETLPCEPPPAAGPFACAGDLQETVTVRGLRIGDIAEHQVRLGANLRFGGGWNLNLRGRWVGERDRGAGTTVRPRDLGIAPVAAHTVLDGALSYRWRRYELQVSVRNLLDETYVDPGVRTGGGALFASRLPQPDRSVFVRFAISPESWESTSR